MSAKTYSFARPISLSDEWDVVVIGGGPAGAAAAVGAARAGAKTILLEQTGSAGGMGTQGLVPFWCPFSDGQKMIYRGIAETVYRRAFPSVPYPRAENKLDWVAIDAEALKRVYDDLLLENHVRVCFHTTVCAVERSADRKIDVVIAANKAGVTAFRAKMYIDATGDGDIAAWAGADFLKGDPETGRLQDSTLCFAVDGVDPDAFKNAQWREKRTQFRNETFARHLCVQMTGPQTAGFNAGHLKGLDSASPEDIAAAMMRGRRLAAESLEDLKAFAPEVFAHGHLAVTANLPGIREGRRIDGEHVLSIEDYQARRSFEDEIGRNCYFIDIHGGVSASLKERLANCTPYQSGESHGIPYRSLIPKKLDNLLLSGRCVASDRIVYGSIRVMPACLVTGQAAGTAAALAATHSLSDTRNVSPAALRSELRENGAWLP